MAIITIHLDDADIVDHMHSTQIAHLATWLQAELRRMQETLKQMTIDLTALKTAVARETTVDQSILAFISQVAATQKDLAQKLADALAAGDPAAQAAVQKDLDDSASVMQANADTILAAITQNTPQAASL